MSDTKLWIDEVGCTATITGANVSYMMPLWVFEGMREIIVAEAEKKVEVTHRDFDIQQELLDRYRAENAKLREELEAAKHDLSLFSGELVASKRENAKLRELVRLLLWGIDNDMPRYEELAWTQKVNVLVRELGIEVTS